MTVNDSVGTGSIFGYQCAVGTFVNSSLILNNGSLKGEWYGIAGNGLNNNGTTIVINGGSISNADPDGTGAAIYHPQTGKSQSMVVLLKVILVFNYVPVIYL